MVLKTFNVTEEVYRKYSSMCKSLGLSMSKQIDLFMKAQIEEEPEAKRGYLEKLDRIREGPFIRVDDFSKRYGLR
ncbi:MAG: hypothetical protein JXB14_02555 [Candidatus Altiarchaeota archaeon]|nr:hypothetical protein [Candidatus Altiarchaeota archaeon]